MVSVKTQSCIVCGESSQIEMTDGEYTSWISGMRTQDIFPNKSVHERELLISGTHPDCWDELDGEEDELTLQTAEDA